MNKTRILWLFNDSVINHSILPLILRSGYMVYLPYIKRFSSTEDWSEIDRNDLLDIPSHVLAKLDSIDFYSQLIPKDTISIINEYFDITFLDVYIDAFKSLVEHFQGTIILMSYSTLYNTNENCIAKLAREGGWGLLDQLINLGNRFKYISLTETENIENDYFKAHTINLPLLFPDTNKFPPSLEVNNAAKDNSILFFAPYMKYDTRVENMVLNFKKDFKKLNFHIEDYYCCKDINTKNHETCKKHSVLFYYGLDNHYIDRYIFTAFETEIPIVFLAGGLLSNLSQNKLKGQCNTIKEARIKCSRLLKGDKKLTNEIIKSQKEFFQKACTLNNQVEWEKAFAHIIDVDHWSDKNSKRKCALLLPQPYAGGVLDYSVRLAIALQKAINNCHKKIQIIFGYIKNNLYTNNESLNKLQNYGIETREFVWEHFTQERVNRLLKLKQYPLITGQSKDYFLPNDNISYFEDCDLWLFTSERLPENAFLLKPYRIILHDFVQRYFPAKQKLEKIYEDNVLAIIRKAESCYTTTQCTQKDAIQYGGIEAQNIHMLPLFFEKVNIEYFLDPPKEKYFLWSTNINEHKNHINMLNALIKYYSQGGQLECYITGARTKVFDLNSESFDDKEIDMKYVIKVRDLISSDSQLRKHLKILGNLSKEAYWNTLANALFTVHPGYADNGNGTSFDAAMLKVPTLSSDYPAMQILNQKLHLNMLFFDQFSSEDIKNKLLFAEENYLQLKHDLPSYDNLMKNTIENIELCKKIYTIIFDNDDFGE